MDAKILLEKTSLLLDIPELNLQESNEICLLFENVTVLIEIDNETVLLISKLDNIPVKKQELIYEFLLKLSNFGILNAHIGLDNLQNALTYVSKEELYALDEHLLSDLLTRHIQHVQDIRSLIKELI